MRKRMINPDFWTDPKVRKMSRDARLLFIGLWTYSNDYGKGLADMDVIKGSLFPSDNFDIRSCFNEIVEQGMIKVYEVDGVDYYTIPSWEKNQTVQHRSKDAIPPPIDGKFHETFTKPSRDSHPQYNIIKCNVTKYNLNNAPSHSDECSSLVVPEALKGLSLYEKDVVLCKQWGDLYSGWLEAYPAVDILQAIKSAHAWELSNKANRKKNRSRFLNNWLARNQDSAVRVPTNKTFETFQEREKRILSETLAKAEALTKKEANNGI